MKKMNLIKKIVTIALIAASVTTTMTACDKDNVDNNSSIINNSNLVSETPSDVESNTSSKPEEIIEKERKIDYSKVGTKIKDENGIYKVNNDFNNKFYSEIYEFGDYILLQDYVYENPVAEKLNSINWLVYDPVDNTIISEKTLDINSNYYFVTYIFDKEIALFNSNDNSISIYDDKLNLKGVINIEDRFGGKIYFSDDSKTMYYITCDEDYNYDSFITAVDISDPSASTHKKTKIETNLISPYIVDILNNDTFVVNGIDKETYLNVSVKNGEKLDKIFPNITNVSFSDNKYFYYDYKGEYIDFYFGDINKDGFKTSIYCGENLLSYELWDYKNNAFLASEFNYDKKIRTYEYYSLKDGSKINEFSFDDSSAKDDIAYNSIYLPKYNAVAIMRQNFSEKSTKLLLFDLEAKGEFENKLEIENANTSDDIIVEDWGDLKEQHERAVKLGEKYGVNIYIGKECSNQEGWSYGGDIILDKDLISDALDSIEEAFEGYPDGFINQLKYSSYNKIKIYLTDALSTKSDVGGLSTCGAFVERIKDYSCVVFDINQPMVTNIYHELSHIIDSKLEFVSTIKNTGYYENTWSSFNPEGFEYVTYEAYENGDLSKYDKYIFEDAEERYFVGFYSLTCSTEDRATIMESAMCDHYFWSDDNIQNSGVYKKLEYYAKCIRESFDTTGWEDITLWEQALEKSL